jgi:hypothetical protein
MLCYVRCMWILSNISKVQQVRRCFRFCKLLKKKKKKCSVEGFANDAPGNKPERVAFSGHLENFCSGRSITYSVAAIVRGYNCSVNNSYEEALAQANFSSFIVTVNNPIAVHFGVSDSFSTTGLVEKLNGQSL